MNQLLLHVAKATAWIVMIPATFIVLVLLLDLCRKKREERTAVEDAIVFMVYALPAALSWAVVYSTWGM